MFLHNLCCLGCNSLNNQRWNWCLFSLFLFCLKKILLVLSLVPVLKQEFNELITETSQRNKHQKSSILLFQ